MKEGYIVTFNRKYLKLKNPEVMIQTLFRDKKGSIKRTAKIIGEEEILEGAKFVELFDSVRYMHG